MTTPEQPLSIRVGDSDTVSALLLAPRSASACLVLAHGAGAGMSHPFLAAIAAGLCDRGIATLRYQFPYMEKRSRRPDTPAKAQSTVRAAVADARSQLPGVPLFAGGKSFGGRMTSQAQASTPLADVRGLVFLGFPLHPANKPSADRARHLSDVRIPMLFLQGTRDALAEPTLIQQLAGELGERATLTMLPNADHSFHVPARSGQTDEQVQQRMLDDVAGWIGAHVL